MNQNDRIPSFHEAAWWQHRNSSVQCTLCPWACDLKENEVGKCHIRKNHQNRLVTLVYGSPSAIAIDPIEKKPVFHLLPGSRSYSVATVGCNLRCSFCQNWELSQSAPGNRPTFNLSPEKLVKEALNTGCQSIAYTYSEPMVFYEYVFDTAKLAKANGLRNIIVSAGYVNFNPLKEIASLIDVMKIDLKSFDELYYRTIVGAQLRFVLSTLKNLKRLNVLTEIVNLIVPTLNDDLSKIRSMCRWICKELGPDTPLFFTRFFPNHELSDLPATPIQTLQTAREIALEEGLHYVYTGNVPGNSGEHTYCPTCKKILVERHGYQVLSNQIESTGTCPYDGTHIPGIWK